MNTQYISDSARSTGVTIRSWIVGLAVALVVLVLAVLPVRAETVVGGNLTISTTWTLAGSPYRVASDLHVGNNFTLTIEPGVLVRCEPNTEITIGSGGDSNDRGTLVAIGTEAEPITFTSTSGAPGGWGTLAFWDFSGQAGTPSQITWCVIENGGQTYSGVNSNVYLRAFYANPYLSVDQCTIRNSSGYGIFAAFASFPVANTLFEGNASTDVFCDFSADPTFTNCDFQTGSHLGVDITGISCVPLFSGCSFTGTGAHAMRVTAASLDHNGHTLSGYSMGIYVVASTLIVNRRWNALSPGMAYEMESVTIGGLSTLTLDPGVVLKFGPGAKLEVGSGGDSNGRGTLVAVGTEADPITFTSTSGAPGGWTALAIMDFSGLSGSPSQLTWCVIENGGQALSGVNSNLFVRGFYANPFLALDHCTIRSGSGYGIYATHATWFPVANTAFEGNISTDVFCAESADPTFTNCDFQTGSHLGVDIATIGCVPLFSGCSFTGTSAHAMRVTGASLDHNGYTLSGYSMGIYVVGPSLKVSRHWNALAPGLAYEMESNAVGNLSTLTLDPGVVLKFQPGASLVIGSSGDSNDRGTLIAVGTEADPITFTSISGTPGSWAALAFMGASGEAGTPSRLTRCVVENGGQTLFGQNMNLFVHPTPYLVIEASIIRFGTGVGIRSYSSVFSIHQSSIVENVAGGIVSDGSSIVDATNNWWGDASGPNDPSSGGVDYNPTGTGQSVTDFVSYRPWLTVPAHFFNVSASAGAGGSIAPSGVVPVGIGTDQEFVITPDFCYSIADVLVDGVSIGPVTSYTFTSVHVPHTISASFVSGTYTIAASAGPNGTMSPSDTMTVNCGGSVMYTLQPAFGYEVANVLVDGASVGALTSYTFNAVQANHTIAASFQVQKPHIVGVRDVPNDHGLQVKLSWSGTKLSDHYWVFRSVGTMARPVAGTADYAWEFLNEVPAREFLDDYSLLADTASDSGDASPYTAFMVVGMSANNGQAWPSLPDSGYSVDNLPPPPPIPFTAEYVPGAPARPAGASTNAASEGFTWLHWGYSPAEDFLTFKLYRDTVADFVPGPANFLSAQPDTGYQDPGPAGRYYKLLAVDKHGNASQPAQVGPEETNGIEQPDGVNGFWIAGPFPNPASTETILRFGLPADGRARLTVYSTTGRRVRELVGTHLVRGEYGARWDLRDDRGLRVSPGVYFVRLRAGGNQVLDRKVILAR